MSLYDCPTELVTSIFELACLSSESGPDVDGLGSKTARALRLTSKRHLALATALEFHTLVLRGVRKVQRACDRIFESESEPEPESERAQVANAGGSGSNTATNTNTNTNTNDASNEHHHTRTRSDWLEARIHHLFISDVPATDARELELGDTAAVTPNANANANADSGSDIWLGLGTHGSSYRGFWADVNVNALLRVAAPTLTLRSLALVVLDDRDQTQRLFRWPQEGDAALSTLYRCSFPNLKALVLKHGASIRNRDLGGSREPDGGGDGDGDGDRGGQGSQSQSQRVDSVWFPPVAPHLESLTLAGCVYLSLSAPGPPVFLGIQSPDICALHPILAGHTVRYPKLKMLRLRAREVCRGNSVGPLAAVITYVGGRRIRGGRSSDFRVRMMHMLAMGVKSGSAAWLGMVLTLTQAGCRVRNK